VRERVKPPADFERICDERDEWLVRGGLREVLAPLLRASWNGLESFSPTVIGGGRCGVAVVRLDRLTVVVRRYRRGGFPGRFLRHTYFSAGGVARPFHELRVTEDLRRRGVPVVEPVAAGVRRIGWGRYRGVLMTRWIEDVTSLWQLLRRETNEDRRLEALRASGAAVARLHAAGAAHVDLNLTNIVVRDGRAWLLDFDRARLAATPAQQARALARLRRSARKVDPEGRVVRAEDLTELMAACRTAG
jgi:3-deoxy-D-manno-octulosonic acid kinase